MGVYETLIMSYAFVGAFWGMRKIERMSPVPKCVEKQLIAGSLYCCLYGAAFASAWPISMGYDWYTKSTNVEV